jgi:hypothetical protein
MHKATDVRTSSTICSSPARSKAAQGCIFSGRSAKGRPFWCRCHSGALTRALGSSTPPIQHEALFGSLTVPCRGYRSWQLPSSQKTWARLWKHLGVLANRSRGKAYSLGISSMTPHRFWMKARPRYSVHMPTFRIDTKRGARRSDWQRARKLLQGNHLGQKRGRSREAGY